MKNILVTIGLIIICIIVSIMIDKIRSVGAKQKRQKEFIKKKLQNPEPHSVFWCTPDINPLNDITEEGLWVPDYEIFIPESLLTKIQGLKKKTEYYGSILCWLEAGETFFDNKLKSIEDGLLIEDNLFITVSEIEKLKKTNYLVIGENNGMFGKTS